VFGRRGRDAPDFVLDDAEQRHAENPRSFFIPDRAEREAVPVGAPARLLFRLTTPPPDGPAAERMWVRVTARDGAGYVGVLTNRPVAIRDVGEGDEVRFGPEHVIGLVEQWPLGERKALVSRRSHTGDVRPGYLYREAPDNDQDSGWRLFVGDETEAETADPDNILVQALGFLVDRWPELRPVLDADGEWGWDPAAGAYARLDPQ
jgi:hypothetical protein